MLAGPPQSLGAWLGGVSATVCVCAHCAVVETVIAAWQLPDQHTAFRFREDMYHMLNVPLPAKPARRVLFWLRKPGTGRHITNIDELFAITEAYGLNYTYVGSAVPWPLQHSFPPCALTPPCATVAPSELCETVKIVWPQCGAGREHSQDPQGPVGTVVHARRVCVTARRRTDQRDVPGPVQQCD